MSRPRIGKAPAAYLDAWQVLPGSLVKAIQAVPVPRGPNKRLFTFSLERNTLAAATFGPDLYSKVVNHLALHHPDETSWRVYFAAGVTAPDSRQEQYTKAEELMALGYTRTAVAAVLGINDTTLRRNVKKKHAATQQRTVYSPEDVLAGYTFLVKVGLPEVGSVSNICGQVAALLRMGHGPKT